ncbi:uncharacterized protein ISCGN_020995 [Ixodes scapularis]
MGASVLAMLLLVSGFVSHGFNEEIEDTNSVEKALSWDLVESRGCPGNPFPCLLFCGLPTIGIYVGGCEGPGKRTCKCIRRDRQKYSTTAGNKKKTWHMRQMHGLQEARL